jgi:hypothetical protein
MTVREHDRETVRGHVRKPMHTVGREIVMLSLFAVRNDRRAGGFEPFDGVSNRIFIDRSEVGSSLSLLTTLNMRSTGLGILPIGSVGMVSDAGAAILAAFLKQRDHTLCGRAAAPRRQASARFTVVGCPPRDLRDMR